MTQAVEVYTPRETWLKARQTGIGGSDAPAICGLSPFLTATDIYYSKTEPIGADNANESMRWGTLLEPVIRAHYADLTGWEVHTPKEMYRHPEHNFMLASVDGIVDCGDDHYRLLECKTARTSEDWGEPGSDEIPEYYYPQVQHYLAVTGLQQADVAVLIGGSDFRIYTVDADMEQQEYLIAIEREFWNLVESRTPPPPQSLDELKRCWPCHKRDDMTEANDGLVNDWLRLLRVRKRMKQLEELAGTYEFRLKSQIGDRSGLCHGEQVLATWKNNKPSVRFDTKAFEAAHPALYEEYCREQPGARVFLVKQPKAPKKGRKQS